MEEKMEIMNLLHTKQSLENELQILAYGSYEREMLYGYLN